MNSQYVQYGCGFCAPQSWLNFDASPTLRFERIPLVGTVCWKNSNRFPANVRYGDITRGLPLAQNSCTAIYCSHILEHLSFEDADAALKNTYSYLKTGGIFRFVLPDLEQLARDYLADSSDQAAHNFMQASCLGVKKRVRGLRGILYTLLGNSVHLWMWDEKSMHNKLLEYGFVNIRRASFGDSTDRNFDAVENSGRFNGCLAMECMKPH